MVTLVKSWSGPNQVAFASAVDQAAQYRQFIYALKVAALARGHTVERSSNGVNHTGVSPGVPDAAANGVADNWASVADIVYGTETTQAHSWISLIPPTGKGNPTGGSNHRWFINCNESNADTTPQVFSMYLARGVYSGDANLTTRPTIAGVEDSVLTFTNGIPWVAATAGSFCIWTTSDGDVYWAIKANGESFFRHLGWIRDDLVDSRGNYVMSLFGITSTSADVVTATNLASTANHRNLRADGTAPVTRVASLSIAHNLTLWTGGAEGSSGRVYQRNVEMLANGGTTADARDMGLLVDVRGVPQLTQWMTGDLNDDGAAAPFELLSIGDLMIPCDSEVT